VTHRRVLMVVLAAVLATIAGCSGSSASKKTSTSPFLPSASPNPGAFVRAVEGNVESLTADPGVITQLVGAGAAHNHLPATDYSGLVSGATFYAHDLSTFTNWAGAALVPAPTSQPAQVSVQDDGGYLLFRQAIGKPWTVYDVGLSGIEGSKCPVKVPADVLKAWAWSPNSCRPPA
jgi:hypothetical protein